jgi:hypothetical protein
MAPAPAYSPHGQVFSADPKFQPVELDRTGELNEIDNSGQLHELDYGGPRTEMKS